MNTTKLQRFTLLILLCGLVCIVSAKAQQGRFRVTLNGYLVNHETYEGVTLDGSGDELTLVSHVGKVDSSGRLTPIIWGLIFTSVMRDQHTGGGFPNNTPWLRTAPIANANPPAVLFEDDIVQNTNAALIIPTIWEWDGVGNLNLMRSYADAIDDNRGGLTTEVARMVRTPSPLELSKYLRDGTSMGINYTRTLGYGFPQDRPVGMKTAGNQFGFTPQALVLTFQAADYISRTNFGKGMGIVPVRYVDASGLAGDYTLFLQVERLDNPADCPANLTSTFTGNAELTTTNRNAAGPFSSPISLAVEFTDCRTAMRITNFSTITNTSQTQLGQNTSTITMTGGGTGTFDFSSGRLEIPMTLGFRNSLQVFGNSTLPLRLAAEGPNKKNAQDGSVTFVGTGTFAGGALNGSQGTVRVTGSFSPRPRP
jgi:hypothetical protein